MCVCYHSSRLVLFQREMLARRDGEQQRQGEIERLEEERKCLEMEKESLQENLKVLDHNCVC